MSKTFIRCLITLTFFSGNYSSFAQNLADELKQQQNAANDFFNEKRKLREIFFKDSKVFYCQDRNNSKNYGYTFFYEKRTDLPSNISSLLSGRIGPVQYGNTSNYPTFGSTESKNGVTWSRPIFVKSPQDVPNYLIVGSPTRGIWGHISYPEYETPDQKARILKINTEIRELFTLLMRTKQESIKESITAQITNKEAQRDKLVFDIFLENKALEIYGEATRAELNGPIITFKPDEDTISLVQLDMNKPIFYVKYKSGQIIESYQCKLVKDNGIRVPSQEDMSREKNNPSKKILLNPFDAIEK